MAQESKPSNFNHQIILFTDQAIPKPTVPEAADQFATNTVVATAAANNVESEPAKEKTSVKTSESMSMVQKMLD